MEPHSLSDDDGLLAALGEALKAGRHPQSELIEANARAAFSLNSLDDELAALVYDSLLDTAGASASRTASEVRVVVFESETLSIEIEILADRIVGQVVPPGDITITIETPDRHNVRVDVDELGCFTVNTSTFHDSGPGPLRFQIRRDHQTTVTEWTHLPPP